MSFIDDYVRLGRFDVGYDIFLAGLCDVLGLGGLIDMEVCLGHVFACVHASLGQVRWVHNLNIQFL